MCILRPHFVQVTPLRRRVRTPRMAVERNVMDPNDMKLECPTSGVLLGALVKAFELDDPEVGGPTAAYLGSKDEGRTARRYFGGETVHDATRSEICHFAVRAEIHADLLRGFDPPPDAGVFSRAWDDFLAEVLSGWLRTWDSVYHQSASGWPHPPRSLGGFVLGRQFSTR